MEDRRVSKMGYNNEKSIRRVVSADAFKNNSIRAMESKVKGINVRLPIESQTEILTLFSILIRIQMFLSYFRFHNQQYTSKNPCRNDSALLRRSREPPEVRSRYADAVPPVHAGLHC